MDQGHLYEKITHIETRLENHIEKIEGKLDKIVELMGAVGALQERESNNQRIIEELREELKEAADEIDEHKDAVRNLDSKVSKWLNRGIGVWIGISALVFLTQSIITVSLNDFKEKNKQIDADIFRVERDISSIRLADKEHQIRLIENEKKCYDCKKRVEHLEHKVFKIEGTDGH